MPFLNKNTLTQQVDLPTWEWTRFAPAVSTAVSSSCSADNGNFLAAEHGRYIYYLISATQFFRYDTWTDVYQQLQSPPFTLATFSAMKFAGALGFEGNVISATSTTLQVPAVASNALVGYDVVIVSGTGAGQRRTITAAAEPVVADNGVVTGVNNSLGNITLADSTKTWIFNQYAGYTIRVGNTPANSSGQIRRILSNTAAALTIGDTTQMNKPLHNPATFVPGITATAGSQTFYSIESQVITVDSAWATTPDATSVFRVQSGMIILGSGGGTTASPAAPFYSMQAYDILTDTWYIFPAYTNLYAATLTDFSIERTTENSSIWERGIATSGTTTTLVDSLHGTDVVNWRTNQWAGYWVFIFSGTAAGQIRQIASNTSNTLTWSTVGTAPDATSRYLIIGFDAGTASSGASTSLTDSTKAWPTNRWANYVVRILHGTGRGQVRIITSNTATALTVQNAWVTNPDNTSVYAIQSDSDKFYLVSGGNAAILMHNMDSNVATFGRQVNWGIARGASATVGGHQPVAIASATWAANVATITTAHSHQFKVGDSVTVAGITTATSLNGTFTITTVAAATTFAYTLAGSGSPAVTAQSTTTLVDASKTWTVNEHAGRLCYMNTAAITASTGSAAGQIVRIASNTANTLTFVATVTAPANGISRYSIASGSAIGALDSGVATGTQSTTTIQDTSKVGSFTVDITNNNRTITVTGVTSGQLAVGHAVSGTGIPTGAVITAFGTGTGGAGTYTLSAACTATSSGVTMTSGWVVNIYAGRRVRLLSSTGSPIEVIIASNTNNTLTVSTITAPTAAATQYAILGTNAKGVGTNANWAFGTTNANYRGRYMFIARGGGLYGFERIDLTNDSVININTAPLSETLTTGTMTAYDGMDRIYFHKDATQRVMYLDVVTGKINGGSMYPYVAPTAIIGNRMEIFTTKDGLKYLWLNRASFTECFRCLLFW